MEPTPDAGLATLLSERHSCRAFLADEVPPDLQRRVFETAQRTASWCNSQPWQVTVASGPAIERFRSAMVDAVASQTPGASDVPFPQEYRGVYLDRRRECGFQLYGAVGVERGDKVGYARQGLENFRLFGAPHVALLTSDPGLGPYGAIDVGGYVQVLLLAMQAHGIAAIAQAALAEHSALAKSVLGIDASRVLVCGISFGYEDTAHPANAYRTRRAPLAEVVQWLRD